jgi:hypothetical protein
MHAWRPNILNFAMCDFAPRDYSDARDNPPIALIVGVIWFVVWITSTREAFRLARQYSKHLKETGRSTHVGNRRKTARELISAIFSKIFFF